MANKVYTDYEGRYVRATIVYADEDEGNLFSDSACTKKLDAGVILDLFMKGIIIDLEGVLYRVLSLSIDKTTSVLTIAVGDNGESGAVVYTFTADPAPAVAAGPSPHSVYLKPEAPTFDKKTGVITIPKYLGTSYKIGALVALPGPQTAISKNTPTTVTAVAKDGFEFSTGAVTQWTFQWS